MSLSRQGIAMIAQGSLQSKPSVALLTTRIRQQIVDAIDTSKAADLPEEELRQQLGALAGHMCGKQDINLSETEKAGLVNLIIDEIYGLGPLQALMEDREVTEILVNGFASVMVERNGQLEPTKISFADDLHLTDFIQRTIARSGRRIDEASPVAEVQLDDGSVFHAVIPPLAVKGPTLTIRRPVTTKLELADMVKLGSLSPEMADFLVLAVQNRANILVSGSAGSGRTTLLNNLSTSIPSDHRVVTIEDIAELRLQHRDVVALQTRLPNVEGKGGVTARDLVVNSLRMRPDRLVIGELRGDEVLDMLQAMNTGQHGSMASIHANDSADALDRMEMVSCLTRSELNADAVRRYIAKAIDFVVHVSLLGTGERKITRISELRGLYDSGYAFEDVFVYRAKGVDDSYKSAGAFYATGYEPLSLKTSIGTLVTPEQYRELFAPRELSTGGKYKTILKRT